MRLDKNTPVGITLKETLLPVINKIGRPKITWLKTVVGDLFEGGIIVNVRNPEEAINTLINITRDRKKWSKVVGTLMQ